MSVIIATLLSFTFPDVYDAELKMYFPQTVDLMTFGGGQQGTILRPLLPNLNELASGAAMGLLKSARMKDMMEEAMREERKRRINYIIDFSADTGHFVVKVHDRNNERAAKIANLVPDVANKLFVDVSESALRNNIKYIQAQLDTARIELEEAREIMSDFQEKNVHIVLGQQSTMLITRNANYRVEYDQLGVDLERIRATIDALNIGMEREAHLFVEEEAVTQDPTIQQLKSSLTSAEVRMAGIRTQFTEFHPAVIALQKEIEDTRELIRREVERLFLSETKPSGSFYETLRRSAIQEFVELTSTKARRQALSVLVDKTEQSLLSLPTIQNELANLMFNERVLEGIVQSLVSRLTELELQLGRQFQSFVILERAEVSDAPSFPILWLNMLVALIFGIIGGIFYCALLEYFERAKLVRFADEAKV
jgi:uncharacterized protein involved in exopolysaccharide biosynthesis